MSMTEDDYRHFVCIVAGDNPKELIEPYNENNNTDPYVVYKYKDVTKIKACTVKYYKQLKETVQSPIEKEYLTNSILDLEEMDNEEFFYSICEENPNYYISDNGDIMCNKNPDGHYSYCNIGKLFSSPFITKDGKEVYQAKKGDIDWNKIHLNGGEAYKRVWEMVMEDSKPNDEHEQILYDNMKDKQAYFEKFETKENYVTSNTAFWGYAFLSDITGWLDAEDIEDQFVWMNNFYDLYIKNLPDDTLLTIYECKK